MSCSFSYFLIILALFGVNFQSAANSSCKQLTPVELCLVGDGAKGGWANGNLLGNCGYLENSHYIRNIEDMNKILSRLNAECKTVTKLHLVGHSSQFNFNNFSLFEWNKISPNNSLAKGAKIEARGCNMGKGCIGAVQMYKISQNLLKQGGKITASTFYTNGLVGTVKPFAMNLSYRNLNTEINPSGDWSISGPDFISEPNPLRACQKETEETIEKLKRFQRRNLIPQFCIDALLEKAHEFDSIFKDMKDNPAFLFSMLGETGEFSAEAFLSITHFDQYYKELCGLNK